MTGEKVNSRGYREGRPGRPDRKLRGSAESQINALVHACAEEICQYAAGCVEETDYGPDPVEVAHIISRYVWGES